ncbi:kinase-like domain-containing protein [Aspergillus aurantiobrunneus]
MDWDDRVQASHRTESLSWADKFNRARGAQIAAWVSTFRDNQPSEVVEDDCGSFNWCCKVRFSDGLQWMVRFSVPGRVIRGDQKLRHEAATMQFVKEKTNIPIPSIIAWGVSDENPLGLGPFMIMEFIEGQPLDMIFGERAPDDAHVLRPGISDDEFRIVYRQIANILLELSAHNFPRIGSLSNANDPTDIESRPLTLKMNEIESHGGVYVGDQAPGAFSSVEEYFQDVTEQDVDHLRRQPNSIDNAEDGRRKYQQRQSAKGIVPKFIDRRYNNGPFKLICDDFRLGNILVNNAQDLKIVAVLDWEWSYAAPYQMLCSPPRWLIIKKPYNWVDGDLPAYNRLLDMFIEILGEEENKRPEPQVPSMATLMRESMEHGRFWFHELLYSCFEPPDTQAWVTIQEHFSSDSDLAKIPTHEMDCFVKDKLKQLDQYNDEWAVMKQEIDRKKAEFQALKEKVEREDAEMGLS